jgi:PAS domain S-box-containing protein
MVFRGIDQHEILNGDNQQVEELLQHIGMMTQQVDQGLAMVDLKGTICFINMACAKMHGYKTSNELLGKQLSAFHRKEKVKTDLVPLVDEAKLKGMSTREVEHVRADRTTFPTQVKMILAKDKSGRANALIVIITDISERKQLQRMLVTETAKQDKELKEQIEQLKNQITESQQSEESIKQQADELTAANEQLKNQITESQQSEESLKQQAEELKGANEQLKNQITESQQSEESLKQQADELKAANEQLKGKIADLEEGEKRPKEHTKSEGESEQIDPKLLDVEKLKSIAELAKRLR